jgi:hypothetical protein
MAQRRMQPELVTEFRPAVVTPEQARQQCEGIPVHGNFFAAVVATVLNEFQPRNSDIHIRVNYQPEQTVEIIISGVNSPQGDLPALAYSPPAPEVRLAAQNARAFPGDKLQLTLQYRIRRPRSPSPRRRSHRRRSSSSSSDAAPPRSPSPKRKGGWW